MKTALKNSLLISFFLFLSGLTSCQQNSIENISDNEVTPIAINSTSHIQTRATDKNFDANDEIGLYVLKQPYHLSEERHTDNMRFKYKENTWTPDEIIYYPSTKDLCDFIAYYPYKSLAVGTGSSKISCEVMTDQSTPYNFSKSDFLVAEKTSVSPTIDAIPLVFKHKLAEIRIELLPGTGFDSLEELSAINPTVSIKGAATQAVYDIESRTFAEQTNVSDIIPAGEFSIGSGKLQGKRAIVVPQEIEGDKLFVEVKAGGKSYSFTFGEKHIIAPSTIETYTLTIKRAAPQGTIETEIAEWENNSSINGDLNENENKGNDDPTPSADAFHIPLPDFSNSSVYKAMNNNIQIAEICREYLKADGIDNQAIVVYPVKNGITDLSKGYVAQILDGNDGSPLTTSIHGGTVVWNATNNTLSYTAGTLSSSSTVYIDKEGNIGSSNESSALEVLSIEPDVIDDDRNPQQYSIAKIGCQYWMTENLVVTSFTDGTSITYLAEKDNEKWTTSIETSTTAYGIKDLIYYYNYAATSNIAPIGWEIPTLEQWNRLKAYINNDPALITVESWNGSSNLTGLSIDVSSYRNKNGTYANFEKSTCIFWHTKGGIKINSSIIETTTINEGYSIRCIKK